VATGLEYELSFADVNFKLRQEYCLADIFGGKAKKKMPTKIIIPRTKRGFLA